MPYYKNSLRKSFNKYQKIRGNGAGLEVEFNGSYYPVESFTHTHGAYNHGKIGLSGDPGDIKGDYKLYMYVGLDYMNVIYNNKVHKVWYDYYNKKWDYKNIWTW